MLFLLEPARCKLQTLRARRTGLIFGRKVFGADRMAIEFDVEIGATVGALCWKKYVDEIEGSCAGILQCVDIVNAELRAEPGNKADVKSLIQNLVARRERYGARR